MRKRETTWSGAGAALAVGALVLTGVTACSPEPPKPGVVAQALAAGIAAGDLGDVALSGATPVEATAQLTAALAGLDPLRPAVTVGKVTLAKDGATATAALGFTWDLDAGDTDWTYSTTAKLDLVEEAWQAQWTSFLLVPDLVTGETVSVRRVAAARAGVLGAGGVPLVQDRAVLRLGIDKTRTDAAGQDAAARQVAALLGIDPEAYAVRVAGVGAKAFVEGLVVRTDNPGVDVAAVKAVVGALAVPDTLPLARPLIPNSSASASAPTVTVPETMPPSDALVPIELPRLNE